MTFRRNASLLLAASATLLAQNAPTIRINVNLVQVDAVVTDSKNKHVSGLKADDFDVFQDGKRQTITSFSFIAPAPTRSASTTTQATSVRTSAIPAPSIRSALQPGDVRRTIALIVDDLGLSFESMAHVRAALRKFVHSEMHPGDLVAIIRTSGGMGVLQQFTMDRDLLNAAIDHVKFSIGRVGVDSFAPATDPAPSGLRAQAGASIDQLRSETFLTGTLGVLRYVIDGLRDMPGRKSIVLFSENLRLTFEVGRPFYLDTLRRLTDLANRASVVINTIDPRGQQALSDVRDSAISRPGGLGNLIMQRQAEMFDSQEGLAVLAENTSGLFIKNNNLVDEALDEVLADSEGYYLVGYHPDAATFDSKTGEPLYHKVRVLLKIPGLHVRSRSGFFGDPEAERGEPLRTGRAALLHALASPFSSAGVRVQLTTLFNQTPDRQSCLSVLLHIDTRDLTFKSQLDGSQQASFEVAVMTFGVNGDGVDQSDREFSVNLAPEQYQAALQKGLVYVVNQPVRRAGMYQMRVALRDQNSERLGSVNEFVEVPDLTTGQLALSSILLRKEVRDTLTSMDRAEGQVAGENAATAAATRVFKPGDAMSYQYFVFNAKSGVEHKASLEVQTRLFRDGKQVYAGQPMVPTVVGEVSSGRLLAGGQMTLARTVSPGEYMLQIIVTDKVAKGNHQTASNWIDFELQP